jgi:lipoprotein-anchoring transpeptidase ErfK/SrfK
MRWGRTIGVVIVVGIVSAAGYAIYGQDRVSDDASAGPGSTAPDPSPAAAVPGVDTQRAVAPEPEPPEIELDPRCERGRVLCADKSTNTLRFVVRGRVVMTFDARFGRPNLATREGRFSVYVKDRDHVSSIYGTPMPFTMFFSGGQAVHFSKEFQTEGYARGSHGCINLRDYRGAAELFDRVRVGDEVVVYRSSAGL